MGARAAPDEEEEEEEEEGAEQGEEAAVSASKPADLRRTRRLRALLLSKYEEVRGQAEGMSWSITVATPGEDEPVHYNVCWSDTSVSLERIMRMSRMQRINHFPGMLELVRKAGTARNLNKMLLAVGKDYKFFPRTFMLPADYTELKKEFDNKKGHKTFIVKPSKGAQGTGIMITRSLSDIDPQEPNIVQRYMHRPHLLDGYKYDLRIYVLLTSLQPLRIYLFREGLVWLLTYLVVLATFKPVSAKFTSCHVPLLVYMAPRAHSLLPRSRAHPFHTLIRFASALKNMA